MVSLPLFITLKTNISEEFAVSQTRGKASSQIDAVEPDEFDCDGQFYNPMYKFNYEMNRDEVSHILLVIELF